MHPSSSLTDVHASVFISLAFDFRPYHKKATEFNIQMHKWLDSVDIRMVKELLDAMPNNTIKNRIPKWIRDRKYEIDYNKHEALDLIEIF